MVNGDDEVPAPQFPEDSDGEASPVGGLVDDLFGEKTPMFQLEAESNSSPSKRSYKPKGLFLGTRRDTDEPIDIAPQVLALSLIHI